MRRARGLLPSGAAVLAVSLVLLVVGTLSAPAPQPATSAAAVADPLDTGITQAQARLQRVPKDARGWASLSLLYVSKAAATGDPGLYAKAEGAARRSLALDSTTNDLGHAAVAAVRSAAHDFGAARAAAERGLAVNPYSATLLGALADALVQLGRYDEATAAVQALNRLRPGFPAFTRASYDRELRGDIAGARVALERALEVATATADQAFARTYLGELALRYQGDHGGSAEQALEQFETGLRLVPGHVALSHGRARAQLALGRDAAALASYRDLVARAPLPQYVLELAELLERERSPEAEHQYDLFRTTVQLQRAAGVGADVEPTLFEADHGSPERALALARAGWRARPFLEMADAYAWALHKSGRDREALQYSDRALATGWPNALLHFHRGMIQKALGQQESARRDLSAALRLNPAFHPLHARTALTELAALQR